MPDGNFFLDLDQDPSEFSVSRLEEYVNDSAAMVVLLTGSRDNEGREVSDYFGSANCRRELRAAMDKANCWRARRSPAWAVTMDSNEVD